MLSPVGLPLAFLAGLLSFVSPCVLPLVPVYLGYLSGSGLSTDVVPKRRQVLGHALLFVGGFTLVFVVLFGLPTTLMSEMLLRYGLFISRAGGAVLILFGLHTLGMVTIPILNVTRRLELGSGVKPGYARSTLIGIGFAAGWTPCIGPLLGTVMTLAFAEPTRAIALLLVYALGLAVPFLTAAVLLTQALNWLQRLRRHMRVIQVASGLLMIAIGTLMVSGAYTTLNGFLIRVTPEWLLERM